MDTIIAHGCGFHYLLRSCFAKLSFDYAWDILAQTTWQTIGVVRNARPMWVTLDVLRLRIIKKELSG